MCWRTVAHIRVSLPQLTPLELVTKKEPSLKWYSKIWPRISWNLYPRVRALAGPSSNCTDKLQTRPLVRDGAQQEENCKCLKIFSMEVKKKLSLVPDCGLVPEQTGWLTVGGKITLTLDPTLQSNWTCKIWGISSQRTSVASCSLCCS
jgi:hypothetical protein